MHFFNTWQFTVYVCVYNLVSLVSFISVKFYIFIVAASTNICYCLFPLCVHGHVCGWVYLKQTFTPECSNPKSSCFLMHAVSFFVQSGEPVFSELLAMTQNSAWYIIITESLYVIYPAWPIYRWCVHKQTASIYILLALFMSASSFCGQALWNRW